MVTLTLIPVAATLSQLSKMYRNGISVRLDLPKKPDVGPPPIPSAGREQRDSGVSVGIPTPPEDQQQSA